MFIVFKRLFLTCLLLTLSPILAQHNHHIVNELLHKVRQNSVEMQIVQDEANASKTSTLVDTTVFDLSSTLTAELTRDQTPSANPFATNQFDSNSVSLGVDKLWKSGISTDLTYSYTENTISFPSRDTIYYQFPELTLTLSTSLFQDFLSNRYESLEKRVQSSVEALSIEERLKMKAVLANSLLASAEILEIKDELELQKELCGQTKKQTSQLGQKYKRRSISKREYLLSQKDFNSCSATILAKEKLLKDKIEQFKISFNTQVDDIQSVNVQHFLNFFEENFKKYKSSSHPLELEKDLEIQHLTKSLIATRFKQEELNALKKPDVDLSLKLGASGLEEDYTQAHQELGDLENPYVYFGVSFSLPVENRSASLQSTSNLLQIQAKEKRLSQKKKEIQSRVQTLKTTLENDFDIYRKYKQNVDFSLDILDEGRKDFNNGRIDFFNLIELQKGLLQSQQQLAKLRTQIVINSVEYLDYHQFFDHFVGKK